jgi:hypothetical protein
MTTNPAALSCQSTSFNCPHCGALAHQTWFDVYVQKKGKDELPFRPDAARLVQIRGDKEFPSERRARLIKFAERIIAGEVFLEDTNSTLYSQPEVINLNISQCYSCDALTIWVHDRIVFPPTRSGISPNSDLPADIIRDFNEARLIVDESPRGAAALLRLSIQKLCQHLGESGKNINDDIANLVRKGLDKRIQRALDIVRVVGNDSVHPGQIDLRDDRDTATKLFGLVNLIAEKMITEPKHVDDLYASLPEEKRKAIEKRDGE